MKHDLKIILGVLAAVFILSLCALGRDVVEKVILYSGIASVYCFMGWMCLSLVKSPLQYVHEKLKKYRIMGLYVVILAAFMGTSGMIVLKKWSDWAYPHLSHEELIRLHTQL